jgi:two-component system, cell cycle sensor histidine kinase and response regulator CckA
MAATRGYEFADLAAKLASSTHDNFEYPDRWCEARSGGDDVETNDGASRRAASHPGMEPGSTHTVEMVVCSPEQRAWLNGILADAGIPVRSFAGVAEALASLPEACPDLVVAGVAAGHQEGWHLRPELRQPAQPGAQSQPGPIAPDETGDPEVPADMPMAAPDSTERNRDQEALRESELKLRSITEQVTDVIVTTDTQGVINFATARSEPMFHIAPQDVIGRHFTDFIDASNHPAALEAFGGAVFGGAGPGAVELTLKRADGTTFAGEVRGSAYCWGTQRGALVMIRDITERKQSEAERERLQAQLVQSQKMESIGRLAGGVAHDFNNLLTVIIGYARLALAGAAATDPMRANLEEVIRAGDRAAALTRQLLAFSRKQVLKPRPLDLNESVREMRPMLTRLMGATIEVQAQLRAQPATVHADPHQLEQVILNLAVNARDAMPGGGRLLIETANVDWTAGQRSGNGCIPAGRYVLLAVSDSGVGMPEETRRHIFEPFFTTKSAGHGTGLGLSMVQGIVAQSGGHIDVQSAPGEGSTFRIYLQAHSGAPHNAPEPALPAPANGSSTVLVVEDQDEVRSYVAAVLVRYGYRVLTASCVREAVEVCHGEPGPIDLLLTDVVMPHGSGRELAARLATLRPKTKVLFMSGYTGEKPVRSGAQGRVAPLLQKPFSPEELARKVEAILRGSN